MQIKRARLRLRRQCGLKDGEKVRVCGLSSVTQL